MAFWALSIASLTNHLLRATWIVANPADPPIHKSSNPNASRHVIDSSEPSGWTFGEHYSLLPSR